MASLDTPTYTLPAHIDDLEGDIDTQAQEALDASKDIGDYRSRIDRLLQTSGRHLEHNSRLSTAKRNLDRMAKGNENVQFKDNLGAGVQGVNYEVGTQNTAAARTGYTLDQLAEDPENAEETLHHENHKTKGHAGQRKNLDGLVLPDQGSAEDAALADKELVEGDEETQMNILMRGDAASSRANQPREVYGVGQKKVLDAGQKTIERYVRGGASRIQTQAEIFRNKGTPREQMVDLMEHGGFSQNDMQGVLDATGVTDDQSSEPRRYHIEDLQPSMN